MDIANKQKYYNAIYEGIVVNSNTSQNSSYSNRVQVYIPRIHYRYSGIYKTYMEATDKSNHEHRNKFPWAISLVSNLKEGNVVYCGYINNDISNIIIFGLDAYNPANQGLGGPDTMNGVINGLDLLDLTMPIILKNEVSIPLTTKQSDGSYISTWPSNLPSEKFGFINPYDNGGWSIGLIQWHEVRAFDLMHYIASKDSNWKSKFSDTSLDLVRDIESSLSTNSTDIYRVKYQKNFHPVKGSSAYNGIYAMLTSDIGKSSQVEYASADIQDLISHLQNDPYNITNPAIIIFLTDILNQYGKWKNQTKAEAAKISAKTNLGIMEQLDEFVNWCKNNLGSYSTYITRRDSTYAYISDLYKSGKLNTSNLVDMGEVASSKHIPEVGQYLWPVPSCDQINCFWGNNAQQGKYINDPNRVYKWGGLWHSSPHSGIDIAPKKNGVAGDPCIAIGDGTVTAVKKGNSPDATAGFYVCIQMNRNPAHYVCYMHFCKASELNVGDKVTAGQVVGYMGTTGNSTGVHLHIGIYANGNKWGYNSSTDILPFLGKRIG